MQKEVLLDLSEHACPVYSGHSVKKLFSWTLTSEFQSFCTWVNCGSVYCTHWSKLKVSAENTKTEYQIGKS